MNASFGIAICEEIVPYGAAWPSFVRLVVISITEERKSFLRACGFAGRHALAPAGRWLSRMGRACRFAAASSMRAMWAPALSWARRFERVSWDQRRARRGFAESRRSGCARRAGRLDAPRILRRSLSPALAVGRSACPFGFGAFACVGRGALSLSNCRFFALALIGARFRLVRGGGSQKAEKKSVDAAFADFRGLRRSSHEHSCEA